MDSQGALTADQLVLVPHRIVTPYFHNVSEDVHTDYSLRRREASATRIGRQHTRTRHGQFQTLTTAARSDTHVLCDIVT